VLVENSKVAQVNARLVQSGQVPTGGNANRRRQNDTQKETAATEKVEEEKFDINKLREDVVNIKLPNYKRNSFYIGGVYTPGKLAAYGGQVGFYAGNFNVQGEIGIHERGIEGYWVSQSSKQQTSVMSYHYRWQFDYTVSGVIGYGIGMGNSMRLTPQVGALMTQLKSDEDDLFKDEGDNSVKKTFYAGGIAALKLEWIPSRHLSFFAAPSFTIPIKKGEIAELLDDNDNSVSKYAGGFKVSMGLNVVF
jgi:hypothetical protein